MPRYLAGNLLKAASKIAIVVPLVRYQAFAAILNAVLQMVKHLRTFCPTYTSDDSGTGGRVPSLPHGTAGIALPRLIGGERKRPAFPVLQLLHSLQ